MNTNTNTTNKNTNTTASRAKIRTVLNEDMGLTAVDAIKEVLAFAFKSIAVVFGGFIGVTKASAKGIREMKADDNSVMGAMASKSIKSNYNMAQVYTYDMATSHSKPAKAEKEGDAAL